MIHKGPARGRSAGRTTVAVILVIIAIVAIVAAILYFTEPAKSLPSVLGPITHPAGRASAHRTTRAIVALAVGVVCLVAAGITGRRSSRSW